MNNYTRPEEIGEMRSEIKRFIQPDGGIDGTSPNDGVDDWFPGVLVYDAGDECVVLDGKFTAQQLRDIADQMDMTAN